MNSQPETDARSVEAAKHYEETLQRDVESIRAHVTRMGSLCELAVRRSLEALSTDDSQLAYSVIIRDHQIDDLEKEIDRLCLEFLVRQQPVASLLRLVYGAIRINLELERIGDYAESIAHQALKLIGRDIPVPVARYQEIAAQSLDLLHDALDAFVSQDAEKASAAMRREEAVDLLKRDLNRDLVGLFQEKQIPFEALNALMMITRRLERVSDQAANICSEVLYMCTGEFTKHPGSGTIRMLFVDQYNAGASQMAEAIARSLNRAEFVFASAGIEPRSVDRRVVHWLATKGLDMSSAVPQAVIEMPDLEHFSVVVVLDPAARKAFPKRTHRVMFIDWTVQDPATVEGSAESWQAACAGTYAFLEQHIEDLVTAILAEEQP